jgi:A/G-specific adenine glycosylase
MMDAKQRQQFQAQLLDWYGRHKREMPWRAPRGQFSDPYHVWLSEIMLQQTTVTAVKPYFEKFIRIWPSVHDLAAADTDDVMHAWAGLGYYARARNLHKCAKVISSERGGEFPKTYEELLKLPGIGPYTASAIASIAFNQDVVAVDGNVERVVARFFAVTEPIPKSKPRLKALAEDIGKENSSPTDFTQAFMELGATICTPKSPKCVLCPVMEACKGRAKGIAADLPKREAKKAKPKRKGSVFWIVNERGCVFVRKRPNSGLLGGMYEFPSVGWSEDAEHDEVLRSIVKKVSYEKEYKNAVRHVFTHFELSLNIYTLDAGAVDIHESWLAVDQLDDIALPSVMQKVRKFSEHSL